MIEIEIGVVALIFGTGFALGNLTRKAFEEGDSSE